MRTPRLLGLSGALLALCAGGSVVAEGAAFSAPTSTEAFLEGVETCTDLISSPGETYLGLGAMGWKFSGGDPEGQDVADRSVTTFFTKSSARLSFQVRRFGSYYRAICEITALPAEQVQLGDLRSGVIERFSAVPIGELAGIAALKEELDQLTDDDARNILIGETYRYQVGHEVENDSFSPLTIVVASQADIS